MFGLSAGAAPDRFLVGLAVLSLLSEVDEERPLLCVVDDAQWLDHASALTLSFVARRLLAEPVGIVFATREPGDELQDLPELEVGGLRDGDARALLDSTVRFVLDERVRDRIIAESRGNPLALLELPRGLSATELAGGFGVLGVHALPGRIEESYVRRLEALPEDVRLLLLVAAAEPIGDPLLLLSASERLGIDVSAAETATGGLLALEERVTFRHPLVRSAVYRSAGASDRRAVHLALAEATDPNADPDRRAWHRAAAAAGPDEDVALELERSAGRAQARGGLAAAAAFLQRAVALTGDPARRADRALAAAEASVGAGTFDVARGLLAAAEVGPLDELQRARLDLLRAEAAYSESRGSDAPTLLLRAAKTLEPLDPQLARETYLDAWSSALFAGQLASTGSMHEVSREAQAARRPADSPAPVRSAAGGVFAGLHGGPRRGSAGARAGRDRLRGRRCLDRGGPPLGLARDRGCRDGVGLRLLSRGCDARGRARPRGRGTHGARGQRQRDDASRGARWRVRKGGIAGCRGRQRHRRHGRPGRALRRSCARRPSGPGGGGI